jgi:CRP-like cAMP-binding protein
MSQVLHHSFNNGNKLTPTIAEELLLASGAKYLPVKKGEYIFNELTSCRFYHQLAAGSIRWINIDDGGKEFIQAMVEPGESFGELPLFDNAPYAASAIANENSLILRCKKETFLHLLQQDQAIHFTIDKKLSERLRFRFVILKILASPSPEYRILTLLHFLKMEHKHICPHCQQIKLTRQQIADLVGLRVETVIRAVRRLHDAGQLQIEDRKIYCR